MLNRKLAIRRFFWRFTYDLGGRIGLRGSVMAEGTSSFNALSDYDGDIRRLVVLKYPGATNVRDIRPI